MVTKSCHLNVVKVDAHLVITCFEVEFGEDSSTGDLIEEFFDSGNRKTILDHHSVQSTVVNVKMPGSILLLHQEHR